MYRVAIAVGYVLPWVILALLVLGICLARDRIRAFGYTAAGFALSLAILAGALGIGRHLFIDAVSPSPMPSDTARVMFDRLTAFLVSAITATILLSLIIVIGTWLAGRSRAAVRVRRTMGEIFGAARAFANENGMNTGRFGRYLDRSRGVIVLVLVGIGFGWVFFTRPVTFGTVVAALAFLLCGLVLLELLRRPEPTQIAPEPSAAR